MSGVVHRYTRRVRSLCADRTARRVRPCRRRVGGHRGGPAAAAGARHARPAAPRTGPRPPPRAIGVMPSFDSVSDFPMLTVIDAHRRAKTKRRGPHRGPECGESGNPWTWRTRSWRVAARGAFAWPVRRGGRARGLCTTRCPGRRRGAGAIHRSILKDSVDPPPP